MTKVAARMFFILLPSISARNRHKFTVLISVLD